MYTKKYKNLILLFAIILILSIITTHSIYQYKNNKDNENINVSMNNAVSMNDIEMNEEIENNINNYSTNIQISLLSAEIVDYMEAEINYSTSYEKATIITLGIHFPSESFYENELQTIEILASDNTIPSQTYQGTTWLNNDKSYAIYVIRLAGEINTQNISVKITTNNGNETILLTEFSNFEPFIKAFQIDEELLGPSSKIIKIKDRYYMLLDKFKDFRGSYEENDEYYYFSTISYVLIPLEKGFSKTLTNEDISVLSSSDIVQTDVLINDRSMFPALVEDTITSQTTITVRVSKLVQEGDTYNQIIEDINTGLDSYILQINNGSDITTVLK